MTIRGQVIRGEGLGRKLGFPTANIAVEETIEARNGVWSARVTTPDGSHHGAVANLGTKPTFSDSGARLLEVHLPDFDGDLYGQTLEVELLDFIRPEQKFPSAEKLREQIEQDIKSSINS